MTAPVCVRRRIRQLDRQGLSHREISRKLGVSRTTVVEYANHGDYSPKPLGSGHAGRSLVDAGYSAVVDGWCVLSSAGVPFYRGGAVRVTGQFFTGLPSAGFVWFRLFCYCMRAWVRL